MRRLFKPFRSGRPKRLLRGFGKLGWGLADAALSSLQNFGLGVIVARAVKPAEFGTYGLIFSTYLVILGLVRGFSTEPLMVKYSNVSTSAWERGTSLATGSALVAGTVAGGFCCLVAMIGPTTLRPPLLALGVTVPGLMLQDSWRMAFFSHRRGNLAFINDLVWVLIMGGASVALIASDADTATPFILAWGVAASLAGLIGVVQSKIGPSPTGCLTWLREHRQLAPRFMGEFIAQSGASQLTLYATGLVAGLAAVGSLRGAQILMGPMTVVSHGTWLVVLPRQTKVGGGSSPHFTRTGLIVSSGLAALAVTCGLAAYTIPTEIGEVVMGDSWRGTRSVIVPWSIWIASVGFSIGAAINLRALADAARSFRVRVTASILILLGGFSGAITDGAHGAAIGLATTGWIASTIWWHQSLAATRRFTTVTDPIKEAS